MAHLAHLQNQALTIVATASTVVATAVVALLGWGPQLTIEPSSGDVEDADGAGV